MNKLIAALVVLFALGFVSIKAEQKMMVDRYVYRVVTVRGIVTDGRIQRTIDKNSREGWRLVEVGSIGTNPVLYFEQAK